MSDKTSKGKKGRKIGRAARKPTHARYNNEGRREKNKIKKAKKIAKELARKSIRKAKKEAQNGLEHN
jgi:hypothetical protein